MFEMLRKYKRKIKIIICGITGFVGCILLVQFPYWLGEIKCIITTDFEAADILGFLGDYISGIGTIILGWIAIKQTEKANDISERVEKLENVKYVEEHNPVVLIDWVKLHDFSYNTTACNTSFDGKLHYIDAQYENDINEKRQCIELCFMNTGRTGIYNCTLEKVQSQPEELKRSVIHFGGSDDPFAIKAGEDLKFNLYVYSNVVERFATKKIEKLQLVFSCINDFNETYKLVFDIEGTVVFAGNNRYEGQLVPCPHPVKWKFYTEKKNV